MLFISITCQFIIWTTLGVVGISAPTFAPELVSQTAAKEPQDTRDYCADVVI